MKKVFKHLQRSNKKIIELYSLIPSIFKNRYFLSISFFIIWISFFDTNSLIAQLKQKKVIENLERDIIYYKLEIEKDEQLINMIHNDTLTEDLEIYLREELLLSKDNEEIFIID
jgi:cell division protein DivIC